MDSTKNFTREGQAGTQVQEHEPDFIQAKKAQYEAEARDSGNQHTMPLVVTVNGQAVYTRDNY